MAKKKEVQAVPNHARDQLKSFINRVERLEEEKAAITSDIKEVLIEADGLGFDTKIIRRVVRERKKEADRRAEEGAIFDLYMGVMEGTPLGDYAASTPRARQAKEILSA